MPHSISIKSGEIGLLLRSHMQHYKILSVKSFKINNILLFLIFAIIDSFYYEIYIPRNRKTCTQQMKIFYTEEVTLLGQIVIRNENSYQDQSMSYISLVYRLGRCSRYCVSTKLQNTYNVNCGVRQMQIYCTIYLSLIQHQYQHNIGVILFFFAIKTKVVANLNLIYYIFSIFKHFLIYCCQTYIR